MVFIVSIVFGLNSFIFQSGIVVNDELKLSQLILRPGSKIMMIGSKEEEIANIDLDPSEIPSVINDFDIEDDLQEVAIHNREEYLAKIERRVKELKVNVFNQPREGKKLLVLDIDYTLFGLYRHFIAICFQLFFL